jgi:DNA polymerase/3'-5' exonuclease PolX
MGVFASPTVQGVRRRVDIKFYPYSERIKASLYFTGNGHFNRLLRLWATRKFDYRLSDYGLEHKDRT